MPIGKPMKPFKNILILILLGLLILIVVIPLIVFLTLAQQKKHIPGGVTPWFVISLNLPTVVSSGSSPATYADDGYDTLWWATATSTWLAYDLFDAFLLPNEAKCSSFGITSYMTMLILSSIHIRTICRKITLLMTTWISEEATHQIQDG